MKTNGKINPTNTIQVICFFKFAIKSKATSTKDSATRLNSGEI